MLVQTYWQILFLLQGCLLLPKALSKFSQASVHHSNLHVSFIQAVFLLLQPGTLILIQPVPQLAKMRMLD